MQTTFRYYDPLNCCSVSAHSLCGGWAILMDHIDLALLFHNLKSMRSMGSMGSMGTMVEISQIRAKHVANIPNAVANHGVTNVGAIYKDESKKEFAGSAYNIKANSKEEIMEFLKSDPYVEAGIWDLSNVQIWPYGCAGRLPVDVVGTKK
ncbi:unnamed protein product [Ambrosiozyma monospora]|uniref:Unnamed protein product n=1 Tax=Ambrosiozyma monospora TaxID=43982 RepID=A0ACB5TR60_AMBMO|nr:unnamed protein product [Ambrosiozyma monospora]